MDLKAFKPSKKKKQTHTRVPSHQESQAIALSQRRGTRWWGVMNSCGRGCFFQLEIACSAPIYSKV